MLIPYAHQVLALSNAFLCRDLGNIKYASLSGETKFDEVPEIFYKEYQKFGERVALQRALDRLKDKAE